MSTSVAEAGFSRWPNLRYVAAVLGGSALLAVSLLISPERYLLAVAAVLACLVGLMGILLVDQNRDLALVGLVVAGLMVPWGGIPLNASSELNPALLITLGLLCTWLGLGILNRVPFSLAPVRPVPALFAFGIVTVLALLAGQYPWFPVEGASLPAQVFQTVMFLASAGLFMLAVHHIRSIQSLKRLTWTFLAVGLFYLGAQWLPFLRILVPDGATGSCLWTWIVALSFGQAVVNRDLNKPLRLLLLILALGCTGSAFYFRPGWMSGWLPPLAAIGTIVALLAGRWLLFLGLLGVGAVTPFFWSWATTVQSNEAYSLMTRLEAWKIMGRIILVNPLLGVGPANYRSYTAQFPILGWYVEFNSHNNYLDLLAQTGVLGLLCFLWFAWETGVIGLRLLNIPGGFERAYVYGALGGFAATLGSGMLGDWFLPFLYNVGLDGLRASLLFWLFTGGLVALFRISTQRSS